MLGYAVIFLLIAVAAGLLGSGGVAGAAGTLAQALFVCFLTAFLLLSIGSSIRTRSRS